MKPNVIPMKGAPTVPSPYHVPCHCAKSLPFSFAFPLHTLRMYIFFSLRSLLRLSSLLERKVHIVISMARKIGNVYMNDVCEKKGRERESRKLRRYILQFFSSVLLLVESHSPLFFLHPEKRKFCFLFVKKADDAEIEREHTKSGHKRNLSSPFPVDFLFFRPVL